MPHSRGRQTLSTYALGGQSAVSSGTVKADDGETTNLDSNLLIAGRVKRRVDTPIRNHAFADGDPAGGRAGCSQPRCVYNMERVMRISQNIRLCHRWQERWLYLGSRPERRELADNSPARLTVPRDTSSSIICPAHHHPGNTSSGNMWAAHQRRSPLASFSSKDASNESAA